MPNVRRRVLPDGGHADVGGFRWPDQQLIDVGKPFKVALTAIMRELLTTLNAIVHVQKPWNAYPVTT